MRFVIIHGAYGNPEENWSPWLREELSKLGEVIAPEFPTPEGQTLENWRNVFDESDENTVLIGHSLGPAFILDLLERHKAKAVFFVAPFIDNIDDPAFDEINKTFVNREFDWESIKKNCPKFVIYHSDNDPYVPLELAEKIANKLNVKINIIKDAGHFNTKAGYNKFERLLEDIKEVLK
jgi:predicted alpha/beta hydrolase family esterase